MTDINQEVECPPLSSDDREILVDLLYLIFQEAADQNKNMSRSILRERLARYFFPWIHVREVLNELVEKDYIHLLTTRNGGIYGPGQKFLAWREKMQTDEDEKKGPGQAAEEESPLVLEPPQVRALADLLKALASSSPARADIDKVRLAAVETKNQAEFIILLSRP